MIKRIAYVIRLGVVQYDVYEYKTFTFMLEYIKTILTKVSFDAKLFEKELRKAIKQLIEEELMELRRWCYAKFSNKYTPVLDRCFIMVPG